jgi:hypothetical protein
VCVVRFLVGVAQLPKVTRIASPACAQKSDAEKKLRIKLFGRGHLYIAALLPIPVCHEFVGHCLLLCTFEPTHNLLLFVEILGAQCSGQQLAPAAPSSALLSPLSPPEPLVCYQHWSRSLEA